MNGNVKGTIVNSGNAAIVGAVVAVGGIADFWLAMPTVSGDLNLYQRE